MAKYIKKLFVEKAVYKFEDKFGNQITLQVNYWDNDFTLETKAVMNNSIKQLTKEADHFAAGILKRKSRVNFVDKYW